MRDLSRRRDVASARLRVELQTTDDRLGRACLAIARLEIAPCGEEPLVIYGHCEATSSRQARLVALAEIVERLGFFMLPRLRGCKNGMWCEARLGGLSGTTNGCAFHFSPGEAAANAILELLERDRFLTTWYGGLAIPVSDGAVERCEAGRILRRRGWVLREHHWTHDRVPCHVVAVSLVRLRPTEGRWNFFLGMSAALDHRSARQKALAEALRDYRYNLGTAINTRWRFTPELLAHPMARLLLSQQPRYVAAFLDRLESRPQLCRAPVSPRAFARSCTRRLPGLQFEALPLPVPLWGSAYCVKARCDALQDIDWQIPPRVNSSRVPDGPGSTLPHPIA